VPRNCLGVAINVMQATMVVAQQKKKKLKKNKTITTAIKWYVKLYTLFIQSVREKV